MTLGDILFFVGDWLLNEPVHRALLLILGALQILLWGYMLIAHHRVNIRLQSVELRHDAIVHRTTANAGDILNLRRNTDSNIEAAVERQITAKQEKQDGNEP